MQYKDNQEGPSSQSKLQLETEEEKKRKTKFKETSPVERKSQLHSRLKKEEEKLQLKKTSVKLTKEPLNQQEDECVSRNTAYSRPQR